MLLASFLFSLMNVCVKLLPNIPAIEIIFFRSIISLAMSVFFLRLKKISIWGNNRKLLIIRGVAGAVALMMYFTTLQRMPLASASTLMNLSPLFATILGIFIVKERVFKLQWLFFILAFLGVIMIKGFDSKVSTFHIILGLGAAFFAGVAYNIIRKLNTTEHPLVIILYFPLVAFPISGIYILFNWVSPHSWQEWGLLLAVGIITQLAQYFMTKAYQSNELSKISILNYLGIIYALFFGYAIFDERLNILTMLGIGVVLTGVILNLIYKNRKMKTINAPKV